MTSKTFENDAPLRAGPNGCFGLLGPWTRHARTWMSWPWDPETFVGNVAAAQDAWVDIANTISEFEPVAVIARPQHERDARRRLSAAIEVHAWPVDDSWMRDIAPDFVVDDAGRMAGVDWTYNDYGEKFGRSRDDYAGDGGTAKRILAHLGLERFAPPLVCEGGALVADGDGTLITTESVALNPNRNPGLAPADAEAIFRDYLGVDKTIWLHAGLAGDDTDGHADNLVAFVAPGALLALGENDSGDANHGVLADLDRRLRNTRDARGRAFAITTVPQPQAREKNGVRLALSYINFCLVNDGVLVPAYDDPKRDADARAIIAEHFPGRKALSLPSLDIVGGGGSLHCITHEEPLITPSPSGRGPG